MPNNENVYSVLGLTASALNADLVPATDVSGYDWISLYVGDSSYSGVLSFQATYDKTDDASWVNISMFRLSDLQGAFSASSIDSTPNFAIGGPVRYPFFRCRMTGYTSGTAVATLQLRIGGIPGFQLLSQYVQLLTADNARIGMTNNDGNSNVTIAAGKASDTVVFGSGGFLASVLVTATGTNQMNFYDNASAGSGGIVGIIPASAAVGTITQCKAPCGTGCTAKGNSNNPGVTVFYTPNV
jgi:hypothetical protein